SSARSPDRHPVCLPGSEDSAGRMSTTFGPATGSSSPQRLLEVNDLRVSFATEDGIVQAVDGVSFTIDRGEVVAIVGESGSGKSVTAMTLMGLTRGPNASFEGQALFDGQDVITAPESELQNLRGAGISMVFQDPMSSLDPVYRVGTQIAEQIRVH